MNMPTTLAEFAAACNNKTHTEIYELFEFEISEDLRSAIYDTVEDIECNEPVREALYHLGVKHNIQALIDY